MMDYYTLRRNKETKAETQEIYKYYRHFILDSAI